MSSDLVEVPRTNDLLASLAVAVGLPLIMLAGIFNGFRPASLSSHGSMLASNGSGPGPARNWSPEMSAMNARLDEAEQRNAMLDAELEKLLSEIRQARDEARIAGKNKRRSRLFIANASKDLPFKSPV